jgi:hypothetical protein
METLHFYILINLFIGVIEGTFSTVPTVQFIHFIFCVDSYDASNVTTIQEVLSTERVILVKLKGHQ